MKIDNSICIQSNNEVEIVKVAHSTKHYNNRYLISCRSKNNANKYEESRESSFNLIERNSPSCNGVGVYCTKSESSEYYVCINSNKYLFKSMVPLRCDGEKIEYIENDSQLEIKELGRNDKSIKGYRCKAECSPNEGYYINTESNQFYVPLRGNQYCYQYKSNDIKVYSTNSRTPINRCSK